MWLGSSLSKPFTDFLFSGRKRPGGEILVSVERLPNGRNCLAAYHWSHFGFAGDWQRGAWRTLQLLRIRNNRVEAVADGKRVHFPLETQR
jgi:hypothetical protein